MTRFLSLVLGFAPLLVSAVTIKDAYTRQMETAQFQRVSEFFTGEENPGRAYILRSQAGERDGLYFFIQLSQRLSPDRAHRLVLEVIPSNALKPNVHEFELDSPKATKRNRLVVGLTGDDWNPELKPVAWRIKLISGSTEVAEWKSFLWEMP